MLATIESTKAWLVHLSEVYGREKERLTELDSPIGDADHGINMDRGFAAVRVELEGGDWDSIGAVLKATAMTLIRSVGGASGPLYGTWFLKAAMFVGETRSLDGSAFVSMVKEAVAGLKDRGKAEPGQKTMIDVWVPVLEEMERAVEAKKDLSAILNGAVDLAEKQVAATIPMLAQKGRASFLGERSIGHQDPGATSSFLLIQAARDMLPVTEQA